jgi:putative hydrolases of HD superfamily
MGKNSEDSLHADIDFIFEVGTMRHIDRAWRQFGGLDFANVTEHTARVAMISMILAQREGADLSRAVLMALVHDLPELRTGDANYIQKQYRRDDECLAKCDIASPTSISEIVMNLFAEFEAGTSIEAQIVKDADNLDCDFELVERKDAGANIAEALSRTRMLVGSRLKTTAAKEIFTCLGGHNSHDWHLRARNRYNAGDWSSDAED